MSYKFKDRHGNVRHMGQVRHPNLPNGKKTRSYRLKKDADQWEVDLRAKLNGNAPIDMDLLSLGNTYLDRVKVRQGKDHYKEIKRAIKSFKKWLKSEGYTDPQWSEITAKLAENYLLHIANHVSNNRSNKHRTYLLTFANWVNEIEEIPGNGFQKIDKLPHDVEKGVPATDKEIDRMRLVAKGQDRVILEAYLSTAARRMEIYRWTWKSDIDLKQRKYRLGTRKSGGDGMTYEWMPMSDKLHKWLVWWKVNRPLELPYVFYSVSRTGGRKNGRAGGANNCYGKPFACRQDWIKDLAKRAKIDRVLGYHSLRRYVANFLAEQGHTTPEIQKFLRHEHLSTTELYLNNKNVGLKGIAATLGKSRNESRAKSMGA